MINVLATTASIMDMHAVSLGGMGDTFGRACVCVLCAPCVLSLMGALRSPLLLQVKELPLLAPHAERLRHTADQMAACLRALAAMVRCEERPHR